MDTQKPYIKYTIADRKKQEKQGFFARFSIANQYMKVRDTQWHTHYISSETLKGNHTADKAFDLQESTYWQAEESDNATLLVIDLGQEQTANAVEYLQMTGNHSTGRVKDLSIYMY